MYFLFLGFPVVIACVGDSVIVARGVVVTPEMQRVSSASVIVRRTSSAAEPLEATTDTNGCFVLERVVAPWRRNFKISIAKDGYQRINARFRTNIFNDLVITLSREAYPGGSEAAVATEEDRGRFAECLQRRED
jgi:hypothetical protein